MKVDLEEHLRCRKEHIDLALDLRLPSSTTEPRQIHEAMRHATLAGGKRVRPILVQEVAEITDHDGGSVTDAACALEFVHTASLVLDDLPSMDNAATRRSRPSTHAAFGEATALLAAMGLIGMGFDLVARNAETLGRPEAAAGAVRRLSEAIGPGGIIHGQHVDLGLIDSTVGLETLEQVYAQKAGALFVAAVQIPTCLLGIGEEDARALETYARNVGLAFQIIDDLIDAHRKPEDRGKTTFATHLGTEGAKGKADALLREAAAGLERFGERGEPLRQLAEYVRTRTS